MDILRISAFADGDEGGNPAGVVLLRALPEPAEMQAVAAKVGYSETAFAAPEGDYWRVRYFSPTVEVAFCGHATIALGAALALRAGDGVFQLAINGGRIAVEGRRTPTGLEATLNSPPPHSSAASTALVSEALALFNFPEEALDRRIPPAVADAGVPHLILLLDSRERLASMKYDFESGRAYMGRAGLVTICLVFAESPQRFHVRNAFAIGGVYEDPATGAAAAALAGYLHELGWPHGGAIEIVQGEDMGRRSHLLARIPKRPGSSIAVSGKARVIGAC